MFKHSRYLLLTAAAMAVLALTGARAEHDGRPPMAGPGGPGDAFVPFTPSQTALYHSRFVQLDGKTNDALLYEPAKPGAASRVAIVTSFAPPAEQLASRGYRVLLLRGLVQGAKNATPFASFPDIAKGIGYVRQLPGVKSVTVIAWGGGATTMLLYADVAAHGPAACQGVNIIAPCATAEASGLAKPDGIILLDPSLGGAFKVLGVDAAYQDGKRDRKDLDLLSAANGYDPAAGDAHYPAAFRRRYFAAESALNNLAVKQALAQLQILDRQGPNADEPLVMPGVVNTSEVGGMHHVDLSLLSRTKRPHLLLKADGTIPTVIIHSVREANGPIGDEAMARALDQNEHPRNRLSVREYLAEDAVWSEKNFAVTDDDVTGIDWKSSNTASPAQAEGISVPALVLTNSCFQFVTPSEIVFDHLASQDKTYAGVEGSNHFLMPCKPEYGDTQKRLFDFVDGWLSKPGRF